jgi:hypothetical protein
MMHGGRMMHCACSEVGAIQNPRDGSGRIPHRLWRLGRLASSCLIAAALSLIGVAVGSGQGALAGIYDDGGSEMPLVELR